MAPATSLSDQAAGLRRLLPSGGPRVVTFASAPRAGRSTLCANLAVAAAQAGWRVLVLDCAGDQAGAGWQLGIDAKSDLLDAARGRVAAAAVEARVSAGLAVVSAQRAADALRRLTTADRSGLARILTQLTEPADLVLVDAARDDSPWVAAAGELVVVARADPHALMQSYRHLKRIHRAILLPRVFVVMNGAGNQHHADRFFGNLCATAERFLRLPLELLGMMPEDESIRRASELRCAVVDAFPQSAGARAARACAAELMGRVGAGEGGIDWLVSRLAETARATAAT